MERDDMLFSNDFGYSANPSWQTSPTSSQESRFSSPQPSGLPSATSNPASIMDALNTNNTSVDQELDSTLNFEDFIASDQCG